MILQQGKSMAACLKYKTTGVTEYIDREMFVSITTAKQRVKITLLPRIILGMLLSLTFMTQAATIDITTEFSADISQPQKNEFTNTTPLSGFCAIFPDRCASGEFSIIIPGLTAKKYFDYSSPDLEKNHTSITVDGTSRSVVLTDPMTGNSINTVFRIAFFGMRHDRVNNSSGDLFAAMSNTGADPSGGCSGRIGNGSLSFYQFGWGIPEAKVTCYKKLNSSGFQGDVNIRDFSLGYTLITPDPLNVYAGSYEGELVYSVGDNGDLNFNAESTSDSEIRIHLTATVKHAFNLLFPDGKNNIDVRLDAQGGWEQWINGGHVPQSLSKEIPFTLSSSMKFTVTMQCGHDGGNQNCGLQNSQNNDMVPLEVALTMPGFKSNGVDVRHMLMTTAASGHTIDAPGTFITDRRSHVDFRVLRPAVETMVKQPGSTWRGTVTLIFNSQTE